MSRSRVLNLLYVFLFFLHYCWQRFVLSPLLPGVDLACPGNNQAVLIRGRKPPTILFLLS